MRNHRPRLPTLRPPPARTAARPLTSVAAPMFSGALPGFDRSRSRRRRSAASSTREPAGPELAGCQAERAQPPGRVGIGAVARLPPRGAQGRGERSCGSGTPHQTPIEASEVLIPRQQVCPHEARSARMGGGGQDHPLERTLVEPSRRRQERGARPEDRRRAPAALGQGVVAAQWVPSSDLGRIRSVPLDRKRYATQAKGFRRAAGQGAAPLQPLKWPLALTLGFVPS